MPSQPAVNPDFAVFTDRNGRTFIKAISQRSLEWLIENTKMEDEHAANAWHEVSMPPAQFMENMPTDMIFSMPTAEELFGIHKGLH